MPRKRVLCFASFCFVLRIFLNEAGPQHVSSTIIKSETVQRKDRYKKQGTKKNFPGLQTTLQKMLPKGASWVVLIYFVSGISSHKTESSEFCSLFNKRPDRDYYSPINIITKDAIPANVSTPVNLRNGVFGPLFVINTGYAFEAYGNPIAISGGIVYGGVLCGKLFRFHKLRAYISQDPDGRSYNMINGEGSPLAITLHYYDQKYGSFEEGLKHPGGALIISYNITHGPVFNIFFILPFIALLLFHFPGTALYFGPEILLYAWFNVIFLIDEYYAFYGSYLDLVTGKEYPNVMQIQTVPTFALLTKVQLSAFQSLLSINGTRLETVAPLHPRTQPVYLGKGYTETYSLF